MPLDAGQRVRHRSLRPQRLRGRRLRARLQRRRRRRRRQLCPRPRSAGRTGLCRHRRLRRRCER
ncbi:MAG: hypothetical protein EXR76_02960 [Myxococcales bacterium]|nr:hypothetical protein [Myxococcales bacterium]